MSKEQNTGFVADIYKRAKEGKSKVRGVADPYTKKKNFKKEAAEA